MSLAPRGRVRKLWRPLRFVVSLVLVGLAGWFVAGKTSELSGATAFLGQLRWPWLALAAGAELASYLFMAALQRSLLKAGELRPHVLRVCVVTFAGTTIQSALPAGTAFAALYQFHQFEVLGADEVLAGWVVVATAAVSFGTLAVLAGTGLSMAASTGSALDLVGAIVGVWSLALLAVLAWNRRFQVYAVSLQAVSAIERRLRLPGRLSGPFERVVARMRTVAPDRRQWAAALAYGALSWLADCACLMFAFIAVGAPVPWDGLLLAYCGGQLAVNLPITPGGLGVVEGSLTVALVAFGGGRAATVAAVLLYRLVSFWAPLPVGAVCYGALARVSRRMAQKVTPTGATADATTDASDKNQDGAGDGTAGDGTAGDGTAALATSPVVMPLVDRRQAGGGR